MLNSNRNQLEKATGSFENPGSPRKFYKEGSHTLEYYVRGYRSVRAAVLTITYGGYSYQCFPGQEIDRFLARSAYCNHS